MRGVGGRRGRGIGTGDIEKCVVIVLDLRWAAMPADRDKAIGHREERHE
jgi:hypothetical protein